MELNMLYDEILSKESPNQNAITFTILYVISVSQALTLSINSFSIKHIPSS